MNTLSRHSELTDDFDGVIEEQILTGSVPVRGNPLDSDLYSAANGKNGKKGGPLSGIFSGIRARQAQRQARRDLRNKSKAQARLLRAGAKQTAANAQVQNAKSLGKQDDSALVAALQQNPDGTTPGGTTSGLSTGAKIGIGAGILLTIGIITFVVIKKRKNKK